MFCQLGDIIRVKNVSCYANSLSIETNNLKKSIWRFHKVFQMQIQILPVSKLQNTNTNTNTQKSI